MARFCLILLILSIIIFPASAQEKDINLLFLSSFAAELPWSAGIQAGIDKQIAQSQSPVVLYNEYLDDMRLINSLTEDEWIWYLSTKYREADIDAIMISADPATGLFQDIDRFFPGIPKIMNNEAEDIIAGDDVVLLENSIRSSAEDTFNLALAQNPGTKHIYIVDGNVPTTKLVINILTALSEERGYSPVIYNDFIAQELFGEFSSLPPDSIVFYTLVRVDANGNKFIPKAFLKDLCSETDAPVYVFWSSLMGAGAIGGRLIDAEALGKNLFNTAIDVINEGSPPTDHSSLLYMFDIRAVRHHAIPIREIPRNAVLINTFSSVLKNYSDTVFIILLVILISLASTIVLLLRLNFLNKKLNSALDEKQLLMQEMNHRVKNDLNILSGLCSMQMIEEDNPEIIHRLTDIISRIDVLGLLHETLSELPEISAITASHYFTILLEQLDKSINPSRDRIILQTEVSEISLTSKQIISCGLILNELVSNIFKHAFPESKAGEIQIRIFEEEGLGVISVSDTGAGLEKDFAIDNTTSLGMRIVQEMVINLNGAIEYSSETGTSFTIKFPIIHKER